MFSFDILLGFPFSLICDRAVYFYERVLCFLFLVGSLGRVVVVTARAVSTALFTSSRPSVMGHADISKLVFSMTVLLINIFVFTSVFRVDSGSSALDVTLVILNATFILLNIFHLF